jgi:Tfp pilus assembly protein PilF
MLLLAVCGPRALAAEDLQAAIGLFDSRHYQQARMVLEKILQTDAGNAEAHAYLGRTYLKLCEYNQAVEQCKSAVELQPDRADYQFWLGRTYGAKAVHSNPLVQALLAVKIKKAFERAVELDPQHVGARYGLGNFYLQAPAAMGGDMHKALMQANALIALAAPQGKLLLARIYEREGKAALAEEIYEGLVRSNGDLAGRGAVSEAYGRFLLKRGRYDDAIEQFKRQIALDPRDPSGYENLAAAYKAAGRGSEAQAQRARAARLTRECSAS